MTDKTDPPGKDAPRPVDPAGPKKPYATIDLKATEVKAEEARVATGKAGEAQKPADAKAAAAPAGPSKTDTTSKPAEKAKVEPAKPAAPAGSASGSDGKPKAAVTGSGAPTSAKPAAESPRRSGSGIGSFFSHLSAGLVGGFLALLGADTLTQKVREIGPQIGLPQTFIPGDPAAELLGKRLADLEGIVKARETGQPGGELAKVLADTKAQAAEVQRLSEIVAGVVTSQAGIADKAAALETKMSEAAQADLPAARLEKLEQQLATLAAAAGNKDAGTVPQLAAITGRLADVETTVTNQLDALRASVGRDIETRIAAIAESSEAARSGTQRVDKQLAGVTTDTARIGQRLEALKADGDRFAQTLRAVQEETGTVRSALDGLKGDVESRLVKLAKPSDITEAVAPLEEQVAGLAKKIEDVVSAEADRKVNAQRIVLSLELANLKRAIERGGSYERELAEVKRTSAGLIDLATLERHGSTGVVSLPDLQQSFRPVAHRIIDGAQAPQEGSGVIDQLLAGARSVVRVRKVNHEADDTSAEASAGRMDKALSDGRLGDVLAEAEKLPAPARAAAKDWLEKVSARHAVESALDAVEQQLKASLSGTAPSVVR
ncbi:MAG: hypothetical protein NW217_14425 [Hyphomicrobiaceae bacterium]|nr:hypothetical protein [Hyphomicrobiaceae bacterium]